MTISKGLLWNFLTPEEWVVQFNRILFEDKFLKYSIPWSLRMLTKIFRFKFRPLSVPTRPYSNKMKMSCFKMLYENILPRKFISPTYLWFWQTLLKYKFNLKTCWLDFILVGMLFFFSNVNFPTVKIVPFR